MEVNAVSSSYKSTAKGTAIGAGVGAALTGYQLAMVRANYLGLKGATFAARKERVGILHTIFKNTGLVDMSKTTVSKVIKGAQKAVLSPANLAKQVGGLALIGAAVGFAVDLYKNSNAKKSA